MTHPVKPAPVCSVIIPTFNCLPYLRHALASVEMQARDDLEIIVIDDGSTDGTGEWLAARAGATPHLRVETLGGAGPSKARNAAISKARGRFAAFIDADDLWWPEKLDKQLLYHERHPDTPFSFSDYLHFDPEGGLRGTCFDYWRPAFVDRADTAYAVVADAELEILAANVVGTSTVVASMKTLQYANGFATNSRSAEDWDLWLRLARLGPVACSSAVTTSYLMRPTSVTQNRVARIASMRKTISGYAARGDAAALRAWRRASARIDVAEAEYLRQLGAPLRAALVHARAFTRWPDVRTARAAAADLLAALPRIGRA